MIHTIVQFVDKMMPGHKTYAIMIIGMAMMVCQMLGYHEFTQEAWGIVGIGGAATWKMGQDRKKK